MGIDFDVGVHIKTTGQEKIDALEKQIQNLNNKSIKLKIDIDGNGSDVIKNFNKQVDSLNKSALKAGQSISKNFSKGINSAKLDGFYKEYFKQIEKDKKKADKLLKKYDNKSYAPSEAEALKSVKAKRAAETKATNEYIKEQERLHKKAIDNAVKERQYEVSLEKERRRARISSEQESKRQAKEYDNRRKRENEYSDWFNKELGKKSNANYGKNQQEVYYQEYKDKLKSQADEVAKIQKRISQGFLDVDSSGIKRNLDKYSVFDSDSFNKAKESYDKLMSLQKELKSGISNDGLERTLSDKDIVSKYDDYLNTLQKVKNEIKVLSNESAKMTKPFSTYDATTASNKTLTWLKKNTKAAKEYSDSLHEVARKQKEATSAEELNRYNKEFKNIVSEAQANGLTGNSIFHEMERGFEQIGQFVGVYNILQKGVDVARQMVKSVYDIDTAMTNLYKVTDETSFKYNSFMKEAGKSAKSLGRDVASYIEQTATWAKLGYTLDQSSELSKISSIYSNVGEVDDRTAVSDIVTVMKAYKMNDSQALNIVDMLNELGNNYATDAASLGDGLKNMASTMAMSNTSLEKSLAILTGGTEITQDAGELGNAIKVAVLRMHGQKGALEDIGEYADDVESVSKMQTQVLKLTKGAVNIMDSADPNSFRDYYDVMSDIAEILPKLNGTDQADLIETLFGKNRANQGQAVLQAFQSGQIQKAYNTALNSEGSAMKEQERWLDSIEAKTQQFKASFQTLSNSALDSNLFKGIIDGGTAFLDVLTGIVDNGKLLPTVLGAIGGIELIKNLDLFLLNWSNLHERIWQKWCHRQLCGVMF